MEHARERGLSLSRPAPAVLAVVLSGEHDAYTAPQIEEALGAARDEGAAAIVDLTESGFVDSTVVSVLIDAHRRGRIALVLSADEGNHVRRMFELTRLTGLFETFATQDAAVAALSA